MVVVNEQNACWSCLLLLVCSLLVSACGRTTQDTYFPLQPGLYWQYDLTYTTMDGTFKGIYAVENLQPVEQEGETLHVRRLIDGATNYVRLDDAGILLTASEKTVDMDTRYSEQEQYLFKWPLAVGTRWEAVIPSKVLIKTGPPQKTEFHIVARVPVTATIEAMDDSVTVPAGRFDNCMRVHFKGDAFSNAGDYVGLTVVGIEETNWYAPGVGLVKSVRRETTRSKALNKGEMQLVLSRFRE